MRDGTCRYQSFVDVGAGEGLSCSSGTMPVAVTLAGAVIMAAAAIGAMLHDFAWCWAVRGRQPLLVTRARCSSVCGCSSCCTTILHTAVGTGHSTKLMLEGANNTIALLATSSIGCLPCPVQTAVCRIDNFAIATPVGLSAACCLAPPDPICAPLPMPPCAWQCHCRGIASALSVLRFLCLACICCV